MAKDPMLKTSDQLSGLTEKELLLAIYQTSLKTQKYLRTQQIFSVLKLVIIIAPFILAIFYLPPFIEKVFEQYQTIIQDTIIEQQ